MRRNRSAKRGSECRLSNFWIDFQKDAHERRHLVTTLLKPFEGPIALTQTHMNCGNAIALKTRTGCNRDFSPTISLSLRLMHL
jgi:hypothetical protein